MIYENITLQYPKAFIMWVTCVTLSYLPASKHTSLSSEIRGPPAYSDCQDFCVEIRFSWVKGGRRGRRGKGEEAWKTLQRTLNLFLFILCGYKMVAKRFSSTTDKKKERAWERRREEEKNRRGQSEEKRGGAKRVGEASSKAKSPREHVCFPKDRSLRAASTK